MRYPYLSRAAAILAVGGCLWLGAHAALRPQPADPEAGASPGSDRNGAVAYPMAGGRVPLTFLAGDLTEAQRAELAALAPNVRILSGLSREDALGHAPEVQGVDGRYASAEFVQRAPNLVWVQSPSAGVERLIANPGIAGSRIVLTNMRAVHGPAIADHAFAMLLTLTRGMRERGKDQAAGLWSQEERGPRPIALAGKTMLVVGLGGIGGEVAQRAHGFGMRVIATRRTDTPAPEWVERIGKPGDLLSMLPEADVAAICVPLTPETEKMFGAEAIGAMKQGSYLINVARGKVVDAGALIEGLRSGRLAGACLDVTDPEPLPPDSPLWAMENVVITPHVAADSEVTDERWWALLKENIRRFGAGEPLLNVVDKKAGY
jgi:phosphoglycerate dehydrogenase-like enzyme